MTQNPVIETMLNSDEFQALIDKATPYRVKIMTEYSPYLAEIRDEFSQTMINIDDDLSKIAKQKPKDLDENNFKKLRAATKKFKRQFTDVKRIIHPNARPDGTLQDPIGKLIEKLLNIGPLLQYIDRSELVDRFKAAGIYIKFKSLEEDNPALSSDEMKTKIKYIFDEADKTQGKICQAADEIKINIYDEIDDSIKYSIKDPKNKAGIKPAQFQKIVKTSAMNSVKNRAQFDKFKNAMIERDENMLISNIGTLEKTKTIS